MTAKLANNASSRLSVSIGTGDTSISVTSGDGSKYPAISSPSDWFPLTLLKADGTYEILKCTARSGDTFTVDRAQEGTTANSFNTGDRVDLRLTTDAFESRMAEKLDKTGGALSGDFAITKSAPKVTLTDTDTTLTDGQEVGAYEFAGSDSDTPGIGARIRALADAAVGKLKLVFSVGLPGSLVDVLTLKDTGASVAGTFGVSGVATMSNLLKFAAGANVASAATVDLTTATGNTVHITGTTDISAWTLTAGQMMDVIFDGILTLTHDATNNNLPGNANIKTAAKDRARLYYDGTTVYCLSYTQASGSVLWVNKSSLASVGATTTSNALTVTIDPEQLDFRSATANSGAIVTRSAGVQGSLTVPSGSTLGMLNGIPATLAWGWIDNAGTLEPFIINPMNGLRLDEEGVISTTAIGSSSNSANVFYSATARANVAYRIRGYCTIVEATAGTWATNPVIVQGIGGGAGRALSNGPINNSAASSDIVLQVGQSAYIDVSAATTVPLHIATGDNQQYEIALNMQSGSSGSAGNTQLNPNNTTIANMFAVAGVIQGGGTPSTLNAYFGGFLLAYGQDVRTSKVTVSTKTISKSVIGSAHGLTNPVNLYFIAFGGSWLGAASTAANLDTTTLWTSLGTVVFPVATTGRINIRRVA